MSDHPHLDAARSMGLTDEDVVDIVRPILEDIARQFAQAAVVIQAMRDAGLIP